MKCIQCSTDNNLKDRIANNGKCVNCKHPFVFDPPTNDTITDPFFAQAIFTLSANNTLSFTPKQLLYYLDQRQKNKGYTAKASLFGLLIFAFVQGFFSWFAAFFLGAPLTVMFHLFLSPKLGDIYTYSGVALANAIFHGLIIWVVVRAATKQTNGLRARRFSARYLIVMGVMILILGTVASSSLESFFIFATMVCLGMTAIYLGWRQLGRCNLVPQTLMLDSTTLQDWLRRWQAVNGNVSQLLPSPRQSLTTAPINSEVTNYSFDRLVVCEQAAIAQLLIANNFHFENNCAILSITGYPENIFQTTMDMLRRNPDLKVYAFHDCSPRGVGLAHQIRTNASWFQNSSVAIVDVGLSVRQVMTSRRDIMIRQSPESAQAAKNLAPAIRATLSAQELQWLESGNFVELESFTSQKLIQVLQRSITLSLTTSDSSDGGFLFIDDSNSSFYSAESFG
jgi:hypothetical protein